LISNLSDDLAFTRSSFRQYRNSHRGDRPRSPWPLRSWSGRFGGCGLARSEAEGASEAGVVVVDEVMAPPAQLVEALEAGAAQRATCEDGTPSSHALPTAAPSAVRGSVGPAQKPSSLSARRCQAQAPRYPHWPSDRLRQIPISVIMIHLISTSRMISDHKLRGWSPRRMWLRRCLAHQLGLYHRRTRIGFKPLKPTETDQKRDTVRPTEMADGALTSLRSAIQLSFMVAILVAVAP